MLVLVVDEGLRALCRQQRANLRCITITRGFPKLLPLPFIAFQLPPLLLEFLYLQRAWTEIPTKRSLYSQNT
jgi:hypothetical protein